MPGVSFPATQGWLNQVARTWSVSSPTLTLTMRRRPRRKGRGWDAEDLDENRRGLAGLEAAKLADP